MASGGTLSAELAARLEQAVEDCEYAEGTQLIREEHERKSRRLVKLSNEFRGSSIMLSQRRRADEKRRQRLKEVVELLTGQPWDGPVCKFCSHNDGQHSLNCETKKGNLPRAELLYCEGVVAAALGTHSEHPHRSKHAFRRGVVAAQHPRGVVPVTVD